MTSNRAFSNWVSTWGRRALCGLSLLLAFAVAMPEDLPAAAMVGTAIPSIPRPVPTANEVLLVHCCHSHPLPPYKVAVPESVKQVEFGKAAADGQVQE